MFTRTAISLETSLKLAECTQKAYYLYQNNGSLHELPSSYRIVRLLKGNVMGKDEWFGLIIESDDDIIIAFRGTQSDEDWITDADFHQVPYPYIRDGGLVHKGFLSIYASMREDIIHTITDCDWNKEIYVTGHSLGGALATLCVLDIANTLRNLCQTLVTFGAPKVGDKKFCERFNLIVLESYRFVNLNDIVPMFPPTRLKINSINKEYFYHHAPIPVTFSIETGNLVNNHLMDVYTRGIQKVLETKERFDRRVCS